MKKLFAIMLCALLAVCAVVPSFAANTLTEQEMTDPFVEAEITTVYFKDHLDNQPELYDNRQFWADNGKPNYNEAGFYTTDAVDYITFWGSNGFDGKEDLWGEKTFQVKFNAPADGYYSFAFLLCSGGGAGSVVPVRIDDGDTYEVIINGRWTPDANGQPAAVSYYGMDEIYLTAGEHIFHTGKAQNTDETQYYFGFQYTYTADEASEDTSAPTADDTTTAAPTEDTSATQGGEQTAPATFDAAVIALAVAGASAAVAVVSKKRR